MTTFPVSVTITYLGHAGFCVESSRDIVIADPWLSPHGAFDSAWFQFPRNHHLAALVQEKLSVPTKARYVYISHEHKDHFDLSFLNSIICRDFTLVLPDFRRDALKSALADYQCRAIVSLGDQQELPIESGALKLFLDDSELNRDSAVLIKMDGRSFLNMNDCRLNDALPGIVREEGQIDVLAAQFSGASWHPVCYDYTRDHYEAISRRKTLAKFHSVAKAIQIVHPRIYLPSAGPPCFLDPALMHLNFERENIFPRAPKLIQYLNRRLPQSETSWPDLMPGDVLDVDSGSLRHKASERVDDESFRDYIEQYAAAYTLYFEERRLRYGGQDTDLILDRLRGELHSKLQRLTLHDRLRVCLYLRLSDAPSRMLRIDFPKRTISYASSIEEPNFYAVTLPSWEVARVLDGQLTWDDLAHTFRVRLDREPDIYQTIVSGFLRMEPEDIDWFCAKLLNIEERQERIVVEAGGKRFAIDRFCPHQGGDLLHGWIEDGRYLTCPRHGWKFDLEKDGECHNNEGTITAICLEDD